MNEEKVKVPGLRDRRRYETQKAQREAAKIGTVHPRRLARSMAKAYCRAKGIPESHCGDYFRRGLEVHIRNPERQLVFHYIPF